MSSAVQAPQLEALREYAAPVLARAPQLAERYRAAQPWRHLVLDDLLDPTVVAQAYEQESARVGDLVLQRNHRQAKAETGSGFGPAAAAILAFLQSDDVVRFVGQVTGVQGLEVDPTNYWAGLHANPAGAFHALHRDFVRHPVDGRYHRANILVYLNPEWRREWGGELELWAEGADRPGAVVVPHAPHVVLFETSPDALHGLPNPIAAPDGIARVSLNCCFYTQDAPDELATEPLLRRPRRPGDSRFTGVATRWEIVNGLQQRTPEAVKRLRKSVLGRLRRG